MGSSQYAKGGELIQVAEIVQHKNFSYATIDWDFSLLRVETPIKLNNKTKDAIKLPKQNELVADNTNALVSGWGNTQVCHCSFGFAMYLFNFLLNLSEQFRIPR